MKKSRVCIDALLSSMEKSCFFLEPKIHLLQKFEEVLVYAHIDRVISLIEKAITSEDVHDNPMVCNLNPMLCGLLMCNLLDWIREAYPVAKFRIDHIFEIINHQLK